MKAQMQKGFTLIELMIVVAIIGILAAIALPAYQDYTKRTHVAEGLTLAASARTAVTEFYSSMGHWPTGGNTSVGVALPASIEGNAVTSVTVSGSLITIVYNEKVENSKTLSLKGSAASGGSVVWECGKVSSDVDPKWRPSNCR